MEEPGAAAEVGELGAGSRRSFPPPGKLESWESTSGGSFPPPLVTSLEVLLQGWIASVNMVFKEHERSSHKG